MIKCGDGAGLLFSFWFHLLGIGWWRVHIHSMYRKFRKGATVSFRFFFPYQQEVTNERTTQYGGECCTVRTPRPSTLSSNIFGMYYTTRRCILFRQFIPSSNKRKKKKRKIMKDQLCGPMTWRACLSNDDIDMLLLHFFHRRKKQKNKEKVWRKQKKIDMWVGMFAVVVYRTVTTCFCYCYCYFFSFLFFCFFRPRCSSQPHGQHLEMWFHLIFFYFFGGVFFPSFPLSWE